MKDSIIKIVFLSSSDVKGICVEQRVLLYDIFIEYLCWRKCD
jgi:hypothetical protein